MTTTFNFGQLEVDAPPPIVGNSRPLRLVLLGDFSGRANRGELRIGDELARCKPMRLDVDTIERVIASLDTRLQLDIGDESIELRPTSIDDLHPDALYESVPLFAELAGLRQRLAHPKTSKAAAEEVRAWAGAATAPTLPARARGNTLRVDAKLSDFARLVGRPNRTPTPMERVDRLLQAAVAPHIEEAGAPDAEALTAAVDRSLSAAMRGLLHHPDLQCLEAAWRSLDFIVRRIETGAKLQCVLYDISAEEFAADLSATDRLEETGLYRLLVEQPSLDAQAGTAYALIGHYGFEMTPPHAELLGRMAQIAAHARAPFIASIGPDCITTRAEDLHPLVAEAWQALRALPAAGYLGLTVPRFLLRTPYGARSETIDNFDFEEFDSRSGLKSLLWGNAAVLAGVLLAGHALRSGLAVAPGKMLSLGDMPYFVYADEDGESIPLPCTERLLTERKAVQVHSFGFMPVLAMKGRPEVRLGGFLSVGGQPLAGTWTGAVPPRAPAQSAASADAAGSSSRATPSDDAEPAAMPPETSGRDAELDALLAGLDGGPPAVPAGGMDPELEAMLKDL